MSFFNFDNHQIFYFVEGEGEPLLLLHGNSVSSNMFLKELDFYTQYFQVISFDYFGHGQSGRTDRFADNFWQYNAQTALELLNILEIDECKVIGTSGGALVGLNLAILSKNLISKLIVDSFLGEKLEFEIASEIVRKRTESKKNSFMAQQFWKFMHGDDWERVVENDLDLMLNVGKNNLPLIFGNVEEINAEVLGVCSTDDELIPNIDERLKLICSKIPNCKSKIYDYGKHPFMITQKEEFHKLAIDFLKK